MNQDIKEGFDFESFKKATETANDSAMFKPWLMVNKNGFLLMI